MAPKGAANMFSTRVRLLIFPALLLLGHRAGAQTQAPTGRGAGRGPVVVSPEVLPDRRVTVRFYAPQAQQVNVNGLGEVASLAKGGNGVWEATVGPLVPGAYRYGFTVDGAYVIDTRNTDM
jgi:hypothetical protein